MLDKIIFGDNQFLGINHRSVEKSKEQEQTFVSTDEIFNTLKFVNSIGIKSFMFTTHDQFEPVFKKIKNDNSFHDFKLIPCIPYAHKYSNSMAELGIVGTIRKFLPKNIITSGLRGFKSILLNDPVPTMKLLIDSEMKTLDGLNVKAIFLQNAITDLLLGLNMHCLFTEFINYIKYKYNIHAGFITMNFVKLNRVLVNDLNTDNPLICSNINKIGFRMNPNRSEVIKTLAKQNSYNIAMSILASGAIHPKAAVAYIKQLDGVDSVLFGASKENHIKETYKLINTII